jgi:hypothetical protein
MSREQRTILERVVSGAPTYLILSPSLGWTINPDSTSVDGLNHSNSQGLRASRDYAPTPAPGRIRMAAFGDSFTHCNDVANDETWEAYLEARDRRLEILNFGVGGYGPDQALLRYRQDGSRFKSHIVVIGFSSENIRRTVNTYRPLYDRRAPNPFAKPRFRLDGDHLVWRLR